MTELITKEEWEVIQKRIERSLNWIERANDAIEMKNLSPKLRKKVKADLEKLNRYMQPINEDFVELVIKK